MTLINSCVYIYYTAEYTVVKILLALLTYFYEDYMYM